MSRRLQDVAVTGVGLAVPGLSHPDELLGTVREGGFDPRTNLVGRDLRHKDRASRLALRAAEPALRDAGLWDGSEVLAPRDEVAVVVSSNLGVLDNVCTFTDVIARETVRGLSPLGLPQTSSNVVAGSVAMRFGLRGPNLTVCNGATSGLDALYWARNLLAVGRARVALVIGVEPSSEAVTELLGEECVDGAAGVVLESASGAAARGARARATVAAYARTADLSTSVAAVRDEAAAPVELWLTGGQRRNGPVDGSPAPPVPAVPTRNLETRLGACSGALGVLQCAAAVAHFGENGGGAVLATAGGPDDDAVAALLFTPAP